jgi:hypothetical protein
LHLVGYIYGRRELSAEECPSKFSVVNRKDKSFRNSTNIDTGPIGITWKGDDIGHGRIRHCLEVFCGTGIIGREVGSDV